MMEGGEQNRLRSLVEGAMPPKAAAEEIKRIPSDASTGSKDVTRVPSDESASSGPKPAG